MRANVAASIVVMGAMVVTSATTIAQTPSPSSTPDGTTPPPNGAVTWDSGAARFEADSYQIHVGDTVFTGMGQAEVHSDPGDPSYRTLEVVWDEQGVEQRMNLYFAADAEDWWVTEVRTYDGMADGEWINYWAVGQPPQEMFRTPRGESFEGDVLLPGFGRRAAVLEIEGLRLTAFAPGTGPGPLVGCTPAATSKLALRRSPLHKSQPLHGTGIRKMGPADAEGLLRDLGLCFTFRYEYPTGPSVGYSERWCTAPPAGRITDLAYLDDGEIVVFVEDDRVRSEREQPPEGWNCPAQ